MSEKKNIPNQIEYAQNLSHELLTPLAIIRSKVELLLQSPNLSEEDLINLDTILMSVERMSKLNKALIILSKLDNAVYVDSEEVMIMDILTESLEKFEDQIRIKQLTIRFRERSSFSITTNRNLVEILITNLIKNAVFHNNQNGFIEIDLKDGLLTISNSTDRKAPPQLFKRFVSGAESSKSIGLGLSIVNKICEQLKFKIEHTEGEKSFSIDLYFK